MNRRTEQTGTWGGGATPPNVQDQERALLAIAMVVPETVTQCAPIVKPEDFYLVAAGTVWRALLDMRAGGAEIDNVTLAAHLEAKGQLDSVGGIGWLAETTGFAGSYDAGLTHAKAVADMAERRRLIAHASHTAVLAYSTGLSLDEIRTTVQAGFLRAVDGRQVKSTRTLDEIAESWHEGKIEVIEHGRIPGLTTGIPELNMMTGGWKPQTLSVIAAKPGKGKSTLMKVGALALAKRQKHVAIWTLEMSGEQYLDMIMAEYAGLDVSTKALLEAAVDPLRKARTVNHITDKLGEFMDACRPYLNIIEAAGMRASDWSLEAQALRDAGKMDLAIVDYLQLVLPDDSGVSREQQVAAIAMTMKRMSGIRALNCPVVTASQLNDQGEVRESRAIEQSADFLGILNETEDGSEFWMTVKKNRGNPTGKLRLHFVKALSRITGITEQVIDL